MSQWKPGSPDGEDQYATLRNNAAAVRALCSAVEGTLGPKGLDTMLVGGPGGKVIITNDGVTILEHMDVSHPAARLMIQVAQSQQEHIGDGTTTATVLAGAMVAEGVDRVTRGVPVAKVVAGLQQGVAHAAKLLRERARPLAGVDDPLLERIAYTAGREQSDIAALVVEAARRVGAARLSEAGFRLADCVRAHEGADSEVWPGLLLRGQPGHTGEPPAAGAGVLVLADALEPERIEEEALASEAGFRRYVELRERFAADLGKLEELGVGLIAAERGAGPEAEQFCADRGIVLLQRVTRKELAALAAYTGARPVKRTALRRSAAELAPLLGAARSVRYDERLRHVRIAGGAGDAVTLLVGAATRDAVGERSRIARDAAAAVQAAVRGGYVPGGGAVEMAVAYELDRLRDTVKGMEGFGIDAVAAALRKPLAQIVANAGFNPLEKVEELKAAQLSGRTDAIGIDCDNGSLADMIESGVLDPTEVKLHALQAAGEIAAAVLRIHTVIKMKSPSAGEEA
ncbi:TCP-1/cpn60 chaperonin family protein [Paenibacillus chartarius]|uniref:TCP-1/cpn60 chaperonin family protein n=1 Tax=Paenibacillus chartarius TaxID=747481 RepID=A0ABV6DHB8_9BACL